MFGKKTSWSSFSVPHNVQPLHGLLDSISAAGQFIFKKKKSFCIWNILV